MSKRVQLELSEEQNDGKPIIVEALTEDTVKISLGFLKCYHKYRIEVMIPESIIKFSTLQNMSERTSGRNCKVESLTKQTLGLLMEVELLTFRSKIEEELVFQDKGSLIRFLFSAAVLGPDKGTPLLRDGIHLLGKLSRDGSPDDDNEYLEYPEEEVMEQDSV